MEKKAKSLFCSVVIAALVLTACQTGLACEDKGGGLKGAVVEFSTKKVWPLAKNIVLNRTFQVGAVGAVTAGLGWIIGKRRGGKSGYDKGFIEACREFKEKAVELGVDENAFIFSNESAISYAVAVHDLGYDEACGKLVDKAVELGVDTKENLEDCKIDDLAQNLFSKGKGKGYEEFRVDVKRFAKKEGFFTDDEAFPECVKDIISEVAKRQLDLGERAGVESFEKKLRPLFLNGPIPTNWSERYGALVSFLLKFNGCHPGYGEEKEPKAMADFLMLALEKNWVKKDLFNAEKKKLEDELKVLRAEKKKADEAMAEIEKETLDLEEVPDMNKDQNQKEGKE